MAEIGRLFPKDFDTKLKSGEYILIDFRTIEEKEYYGYIEGTHFLYDVYKSEIVSQINSLDKSKKYLIYCFHGNRTQSVLAFMRDNNFEHVYDLIGGIEYWENYGYKLKKD
ncbi:MAG: rhodanese-like domain-containing protein [Candidatus Gracilibacteria bacterium]|nr:rhodanese-like domain-containing protein [Candidatus Gracilibacteria bacterium]